MDIGVIGGSGLYQLEGKGELLKRDTPFGAPSGEIYKETRGENTLYFLPRHGKGHVLTPSEVNYRANLFALKQLGVRTVVSVSAVGSLQAHIAPGHFVLPEQFIDRTQGGRKRTYFGNGIVAHAHFADPVCGTLRSHLQAQLGAISAKTHVGGTYVCMEGPQFSTRAESHLYRSWGGKIPMAVIGMTALPEAYLARELGMCYQTVAMATDYDCWNEDHGDVTVEAVLKTIHENVNVSRRLIDRLFTQPFPSCQSGCRDLMKSAVITPKELWPSSRREELEVILS